MHNIRRLDINIAYACNLACKGVMPYDDIIESIDTWKSKLHPEVTSIFGGEPLLHPRIYDVFDYVKQAWPDTTIRLITNGYLLSKAKIDKFFKNTPFESK